MASKVKVYLHVSLPKTATTTLKNWLERRCRSSELFWEANSLLVRHMFSDLDVERFTIVMVLRRQDRFLESNYSQLVQGITPLEVGGYDAKLN